MLSQLLNELTYELSKSSPTPELDAELLLAHVLGQSREYLPAHPEATLSATQLDQLNQLKNKRLKSYPVSYLTNRREFWGHDFYVDESVLVPRPETELLVEEALRLLFGEQPKYVIDVGTGSGCIAISLAKEDPTHTYLATDFSTKALRTAYLNALKHAVEPRITFYHGHLLEPLFYPGYGLTPKNLLVIANLPYLDFNQPHHEADRPDHDGLRWEPKEALDGGEQGLELYRDFWQQLKNYGVSDSDVLMEIAPHQKDLLRPIVQSLFPQAAIDIKQDLAGKDRMMVVKM